jgi:hypothetical protein
MIDCSGSKFLARNALMNSDEVDSVQSISSCPSSASNDERTDSGHKTCRLKYIWPQISVEPYNENFVIIKHKSNRDKSLVIIPKFFSQTRIQKMQKLFNKSKSCFQINDRKDDLYHSHVAYRVEIALRLEMSKIYRRVMDTTTRIADQVWDDIRKTVKKNRVIPEMEYIIYDVEATAGDKGAFIEPHVDNHSICTGIAMLSMPDRDFVGGLNRFKGSSPDNLECSFREYKLSQGDLVLFRGEIVTHWITPVTSGRREILQWELSRI